LLAVWALETQIDSEGYRGEEGEVVADGGGSRWCPEFGARQTDQRYDRQVGLHTAGSAPAANSRREAGLWTQFGVADLLVASDWPTIAPLRRIDDSQRRRSLGQRARKAAALRRTGGRGSRRPALDSTS
jgi:hypothetical protein